MQITIKSRVGQDIQLNAKAHAVETGTSVPTETLHVFINGQYQL